MSSKEFLKEQKVDYGRKNIDTIDLTKFVMSLLVVVIHVNPFGTERPPVISRIAVPVFFMISAYFLFIKGGTKENLIKYIRRNITLYFVWFMVLLPITIYIRKYYMIKFPNVLGKILVDFFFGSTFITSWYLMAAIIGSVFVIVLCRYVGNMITILIGLLLYMICCALTNYAGLFSEFAFIYVIKEYYPANFYNSFPAAILWIAFGKVFADNKFKIRKGISITCLIISIVLLIYEKYLVTSFCYTDDCYVMLIPSCFFLFALIKECRIAIPYAHHMRVFSTITFCLHASLQTVIRFILKHMFNIKISWEGLLVFGLTVMGCMAVAYIIKKLESKGIKWMKAFY